MLEPADEHPNEEVQNREEEVSNEVEDSKTTWLENATKLLLSLVAEMKPKVCEIKNQKKMWVAIKEVLNESGYNYSSTQIENKYRALERRFKEMRTNNNQTGRDRLTCPYEKELAEILLENATVNPEHLLGDEEVDLTLLGDIGENQLEHEISNSSGSTSKSRKRKMSVAEQLEALNEQRKEEAAQTKAYREEVVTILKDAVKQKNERELKKQRLLAEKNELLKTLINTFNKSN